MLLDAPTLDHLKQVELGLLRDFVRCCEELGLRYYLMGGTLLGAVRHQGFIPWDDDIDVGLAREDFDTFVERGQDLLPGHVFLQCRATDPAVPFGFAKLRDSRTTFIESSMSRFPMNHGAFIDVFPLDPYPEGTLARPLFGLRKRLLDLRIRGALSLPAVQRHGKSLELAAEGASRVLSLRYRSLAHALDARERLYRSVGKSALWANHEGAWGLREVVPATWYGPGAPGRFEDLDVTLPANYDAWLTQVYGDYLTPPPPEKRVPHHYVDVVDLERPYTHYLGER